MDENQLKAFFKLHSEQMAKFIEASKVLTFTTSASLGAEQWIASLGERLLEFC